MDADRKARLIRDWIEFYVKQPADPTEHNTDLPEFWAVMELDNAAIEEPELAWTLILDLLAVSLPSNAFGCLAAGPLEEIIHYHGDEFIDRIEREARENEQFRNLLGGVWESSSPAVWTRVAEARGKPW